MKEKLGNYIFQEEVGKDVAIDFALTNTDFNVHSFSGYDKNWKETIEEIFKKEPRIDGVFCSIECKNYIFKKYPYSTWIPHNNIMDWSCYSTVIPYNYLLNPDGIILPYGSIIKNVENIEKLFGNKIFIKPNSPWKAFTGFSTSLDNLFYELNSITQLEKVNKSELTLISSHKQIDNTEFRFWCINEEIITYAPYTWQHNEVYSELPEDAIHFVYQILSYLYEYTDNGIVIDIVNTPNGLKLIELNALSTSGWYRGMDVDRLLKKLKEW